MTTQRSEVEAWLGDGHGLTADQVRTLTEIAAGLSDREAPPLERLAVLSAARRVMVETPAEVVAEFGARLVQLRSDQQAALAALRYLAVTLVEPPEAKPKGVRSQSGFATLAGVDRMTVLKWLGLR
jgi:hypothetical protein